MEPIVPTRMGTMWAHGHAMKCRWSTLCAKCGTTILQGEDIKPQYRRAGMENGKPVWQRVPKAYVHAPRCPKPKPPPDVDPRTGEIKRDHPDLTLFGTA